MIKKNLLLVLMASSFIVWGCGNKGNKSADGENTDGKEMTEGAHDHGGDAEGEMKTVKVPADAKVFFANLNDGDTITSPVLIEFGLEGMQAGPAGKLEEGFGHHHLIIDGSFLEKGGVVPADENNIHYGKGQTEAEIELSPGEHTLTMQFADGLHQSLGKKMSATISVYVDGEAAAEASTETEEAPE